MRRLPWIFALLLVAGCVELPPADATPRASRSREAVVTPPRQATTPAEPIATEQEPDEEPIVIEIKGSKDADDFDCDLGRSQAQADHQAWIAELQAAAESSQGRVPPRSPALGRRSFARRSSPPARVAAQPWQPSAPEPPAAQPPADELATQPWQAAQQAAADQLAAQQAAADQRAAQEAAAEQLAEQQAAAEAQRAADIQHWQDLRAAIEQGNPANENGINGCDLMIQNLSR